MTTSMSLNQAFLINGRNDIALSLLDRGLSYGDGVFRTIRIMHSVPDHWALHLKKLVEDCNVLGIVCPSAELLLADIEHLFSTQEIAVAKIIITRGESARGYAVPILAQPTRILIKTAYPDYPAANSDEGVRLHLCKLRLSHQPALAGIKHLNRLENVMARMEWTDSKIAEGVMLDEKGYVVECTASNLFARFGRTILTPDLSQCGVAGVTRQRVLELAPSLGYRTKVTRITLNKLMQADEVIICNSLYGAWQVREFNNQYWPALKLATQLRNILQD